jgi:hypothetical protein
LTPAAAPRSIEAARLGGQASLHKWERVLKELLRTNDMVRISWISALLEDAGIESVVLDGHASVVEGSIGAIQRRIMVLDEDWKQARRVLEDAREL